MNMNEIFPVPGSNVVQVLTITKELALILLLYNPLSKVSFSTGVSAYSHIVKGDFIININSLINCCKKLLI